MEESFIQQWQMRLWEYERGSLYALSDLPETLSPDSITTYIKKNKLKHQLGSNVLMWILLIWLPLLLLTTVNLYLFFFLVQLLITIVVQFWGIIFLTICILYGLVFFNSAEDDEFFNIILFPLFWFGFGFACFCHLPFLPLLKVRQLQLQYSLRYHKSFFCTFWRSPPQRLKTAKPYEYLNSLDESILAKHRTYITPVSSQQRNNFPSYYQHLPVIDGIQPKHYQSLRVYLLPRCELLGYLMPFILAGLGVLGLGIFGRAIDRF